MHSIEKIELLSILFILIVILDSSISYAGDVIPGLMYSSKPFYVNEYNVTDVILEAENLGYAIRVEISPALCKGEPIDSDKGCLGADWEPPVYKYINTNNSETFLEHRKKLYANKETDLFDLKYSDLFVAMGSLPHESYNFIATFKTTNNTLTTEEINEIIVNELLSLGIIDEPITIEFEEGYPPPIPSSDSSFGKNYLNKEIVNLFSVIIILIIIITTIYLIRKRHKTWKVYKNYL